MVEKKANGRHKKARSRNMGTNCEGSSRQTSSTFCPLTAVEVLRFITKKITSFEKQMNRAKSHTKIMKGKKGKKGNFASDAERVKDFVGGDFAKPSCGTNSSEASEAGKLGEELEKCSQSIEDGCKEITLNATLTGECTTKVNAFKTKVEECKKSITDCACWENASSQRTFINTCDSLTESNNVKAKKNTCVKSMQTCKRSQDSAIQFAANCPIASTPSSSMTTGAMSTAASGRRVQYLADVMSKNFFKFND